MRLPDHGTPREELLTEMGRRRAEDVDWTSGRMFSLLYRATPEVDAVLHDANDLYVHDNALNPFAFPSTASMHNDVVDMTASLLNCPEGGGGSMTSGGTESIIMAMKVARDRARAERGLERSAILVPWSAHPAFAKAADLLGMDHRTIPLADDYRADVGAAADLLTDDVAVLVGGAPSYPHGLIDPVEELSGLALERGVPFHTDSCVGGFLLPFLERLGREISLWDFRLPGVSSMSADVHKYGYATKGSSAVLYREKRWWEQHQLFLYDDWPGGVYGSPAIAGARGAAPIAAAWAVMNHLGEDGYLDLARRLMEGVDRLLAGIRAIPELEIIGDPRASAFAVGSDTVNIFAVGDRLAEKDYHVDRQNHPDALHFMMSPGQDVVIDDLLVDLREAASEPGDSEVGPARYN